MAAKMQKNSTDSKLQKDSTHDDHHSLYDGKAEKETTAATNHTTSAPPPDTISTNVFPGGEILFIAIICLSQMLTQASFGQMLFTSQRVGLSLGAKSPGQQSWTIASYSLTVGTFVLPAGRLGDIYGHKLMILIGWMWFGAASIIAGLSTYAPKGGQGALIMFSIFQAVRGIGPALLLPNSLAILGRSYPEGNKKNMVFALFAMCAPTGAILGGTFGAIFAQLVWWPWMMWSIGIAQIAIGAVASWAIPANNEKTDHNQKFDALGAALGVAGLILFNVAWNQAGVVGWTDPYVPVLLALGVLLLVGFFFHEKRSASALLPLIMFTPGTCAALAVVSLGWASFGVTTFYSIQYIQNIRGYSILSTLAQLVPFAPAGIIAALATGLLISKIPSHWLMSFSAAAFLTGACLVATMPVHQSYWAQSFVAFIIEPFGMDISFPAAALVLSNRVPKHLQGVSASLINTVVNYSISIGLGVAATAEREVRLNGVSELDGYRAALYTGIGTAGAALAISVLFGLSAQIGSSGKPKEGSQSLEEKSSPTQPAGGHPGDGSLRSQSEQTSQ